jgi:hypothetical protein
LALSASGNTFVVASTHGNTVITATIEIEAYLIDRSDLVTPTQPAARTVLKAFDYNIVALDHANHPISLAGDKIAQICHHTQSASSNRWSIDNHLSNLKRTWLFKLH